MESKTAFVTVAKKGFGLATVRFLAEKQIDVSDDVSKELSSAIKRSAYIFQ